MKSIYLIGFGSQGSAWAQILRLSNWQVKVYLAHPSSQSFSAAQGLGFNPALLPTLAQDLEAKTLSSDEDKIHPLVALLIPDQLIGSVYRDFLAVLPFSLTLVLAHGYAVYSGDLRPSYLEHELAMLAPKAIGPKLLEEARRAFAQQSQHKLVAAFQASSSRRKQVLDLGESLGFARENLVEASFDQETIGDLLSEQGLLCGGVFTLLEWTMEAMLAAGIPAKLVREECLTELELIASLLREKGPARTFQFISQAAQCGAVQMRHSLEASDAKKVFLIQLEKVLNKNFTTEFTNKTWKDMALSWVEQFKNLENQLGKKS